MTPKLLRLFRLLAATCLLEAGVGLYEIGRPLLVYKYSYPWRLLLYNYPQSRLLFYLTIIANVVFIVMFVCSAALLLGRNRKGLKFLIWTLCAEIVYAVAIFVSSVLFGVARVMGSKTSLDVVIMTAATLGNNALLVQVWTAYPLVAVILIYLAHRSLRARPDAESANA